MANINERAARLVAMAAYNLGVKRMAAHAEYTHAEQEERKFREYLAALEEMRQVQALVEVEVFDARDLNDSTRWAADKLQAHLEVFA